MIWFGEYENKRGEMELVFEMVKIKKKKKEILRKCQGICENLKIIASSSRMVLSFTFT